MAIKAPRGTFDILPERAVVWNRVETTARRIFELWGYGEIRTPIFENVELFASSIGETTDIVEKEMYVFQKGRERFALRPEETASVVRAYIEHNLSKIRSFQKFYYIGPMFRAERPQAGRYRQLHQIGVEAIGSSDPLLDAECIMLANTIFGELGIKGYNIRLNTLGGEESRAEYRTALKQYLDAYSSGLCENCRARIERNVFRALDCKNEGCRQITRTGPAIQEYLVEADRTDFATLTAALDDSGVEYEIDGFLVRGLDYYTGIVYEFLHGELGAQNAICGGGRYDNLVAQHGGPKAGATGFAFGVERAIMSMPQAESPDPRKPLVAFVNVGEEVKPRVFEIVTKLRAQGVAADMDFENRSPKAQMRAADRLGVPFVVFIGHDEIQSGNVAVKNMQNGEQTPSTLDGIADIVRR